MAGRPAKPAGNEVDERRHSSVSAASAICASYSLRSGRSPETYPKDEQAAHWRDVDSVAEEISLAGGRIVSRSVL